MSNPIIPDISKLKEKLSKKIKIEERKDAIVTFGNTVGNTIGKLLRKIPIPKKQQTQEPGETQTGDVPENQPSETVPSPGTSPDEISNSEKCAKPEKCPDPPRNSSRIRSKNDSLEELSGEQFGMAIRKKMEIILRKRIGGEYDLCQLINEAYGMALIDSKTRYVLHKIRIYGNECAHSSNVKPIDAETKKKWIAQIERLEKELARKH